ncbi:MAG: hypothetical protein CMH57_03295 [Myxococcales bacterium]|nr:hypothetical protein [Myxococcales bacterium]
MFLDIDGVLNSDAWDRHQRSQGGWCADSLDPATVINLNRIVERTATHVVLSSTWRLMHDLTWMNDHLRGCGFDASLIGFTPKGQDTEGGYALPRGWEIQRWLETEGARLGVERCVILDDNRDMRHLDPLLVCTPMSHGLSADHVEEAVARIEQPIPAPQPMYHDVGKTFRWYDVTSGWLPEAEAETVIDTTALVQQPR